jgi:hypothetical protein
MKKRFIYKKYAIDYICPACGIQNLFNLNNFIIHLNTIHPNLSKTRQSRMIRNLSFKINRFNFQNEKNLNKEFFDKQREEKRERIKRFEAIKLENAQKLDELKKSVFKVLESSQINPKILKQLNSIKKLDVLKHHIMIKLKESHHKELDLAGIDFRIQIKKRKRKDTKIKTHDKVRKSIRAISTPMGNKR